MGVIYKSNMNNCIRFIEDISNENVQEAMSFLKEKIQDELSKQGSGNIYHGHQASAPGEPPSTDTGELRNSVTTKLKKYNKCVVGDVQVESIIGAYLEFGTGTIAPRPFFKKTYKANLEEIKAILRRGK